jgi:hypothetical protein
LEIQDVWQLDAEQQMANVSAKFQNVLAAERMAAEARVSSKLRKKNQINFLNAPTALAIWKMFRKEFILTGILKGLNTFVQFIPALLVCVSMR